MFALPLLLAAAPPDFDRDIAPLLARRCLGCHAGADPKGDLDLTRKATAAPTFAKDGTAIERVEADEMPPKHPLPASEKQLLKAWADAGAKWGTDPIDPLAYSSDQRAGRDWWSLQPVRRPAVPAGLHPVDHFLNAKQAEKKLTPNPPADARTLVRRLFFDLTGLPPTPADVAAFARDPSPAAYEALVDRLLASPAYGERWARHWLDVARYGESDGFESNKPRPNAWPYRDWVVRSFNADTSFDRFARWQVAGDVLAPDDPDAVAATGFLVAGTHNTVVGSNPVARETARQDELEDLVSAVGQGFLGLSVQCGRCHDHKFDPVSQADFYRLAAALAGVTFGDRPVMSASDRQVRQTKEAELRAKLADVQRRLRVPDGPKPVPVARWGFDTDGADELGGPPAVPTDGAKVANGRLLLPGGKAHAVAGPLPFELRGKTLAAWVRFEKVEPWAGVFGLYVPTGQHFDAVILGERQRGKWMAGSDFFRRTRDLEPAPEPSPTGAYFVAVSYHPDGQVAVYRNGKPYGRAYPTGGPFPFPAGETRAVFGVPHLFGSPHLHGDIDEARIYDRPLSDSEVEAVAAAGPGPVLTPTQRSEREPLLNELRRLLDEMANLPAPRPVFAVVPKTPTPTFLLARGNVEAKRDRTPAGGVSAVGRADFHLPPDAPDADRRRRLAEWLTAPDNPLFARVVVNRLWHHHFGTGLVDTPSDFGFNGGRPSHPELLDWLASELVRQGFRLKPIHKLMVTSAAYRRSSAKSPAATVDADNRLLWRMTPRRLEAEAVRDAMLAVSGRLDRTVGGPPFHDVRTFPHNNTTYYEPISAPSDRRTLYRFSPRGERPTVLEAFDCPDPSAQTPRRQATTTPLQALALWNGEFVLAQAGHLAERLRKDAKTVPERVTLAYRLALARDPLPAERGPAEELVREHGPAALGRVLFNTAEFVVIE